MKGGGCYHIIISSPPCLYTPPPLLSVCVPRPGSHSITPAPRTARGHWEAPPPPSQPDGEGGASETYPDRCHRVGENGDFRKGSGGGKGGKRWRGRITAEFTRRQIKKKKNEASAPGLFHANVRRQAASGGGDLLTNYYPPSGLFFPSC